MPFNNSFFCSQYFNINSIFCSQYSIHYTRLRVSSSGAVECNVRAKNQIIHNITDLGNDVKVIYSPGFLTGQRYAN